MSSIRLKSGEVVSRPFLVAREMVKAGLARYANEPEPVKTEPVAPSPPPLAKEQAQFEAVKEKVKAPAGKK